MQQELTLWLSGFFMQLFNTGSQPAPAPVLPLDTFTETYLRTVGCQLCQKRLWTDYTGVVYKPPSTTSEPPPPLPNPGDWTHEYYRGGQLIFHDVCNTCLKKLKEQEQRERSAKRNKELAAVRKRQREQLNYVV